MTVCLSRYCIDSSHGLRNDFSNTYTQLLVSVQGSQESTSQMNVTTTVLYLRTG